MKTVSVSEIIRTAQLGDTLYILSSEVGEEIKLISKSYESNSQGWQAEIVAANERIKMLEDEVAELRFNHPGEGTVRCTCNNYPHTPNCGLDERLVKLQERIKVLEDALRPMLEVCKGPKSYDLVRVSEIISKALEVKP